MIQSKKYFYVLAIVLLAGLSSASEVVYKIDGTEVSVEISTSQSETIFLPTDYSDLQSTAPYVLSEGELSTGPADIKFNTEDYIKKTGEEYIFTLLKPLNSGSTIKVYLPKNHILSDNMVFPKGYDISSDGTNIILEWKNFKENEIIVFYKGVTKSSWAHYLVISLLLIIFAAIFYIQQKKFKEKIQMVRENQIKAKKKIETIKKTSITKNLLDEEKKIVEYLMLRKNKSAWTSEISRDLEIPKVRLSRKIRSLLEKGLIKREAYGNKNKIFLN